MILVNFLVFSTCIFHPVRSCGPLCVYASPQTYVYHWFTLGILMSSYSTRKQEGRMGHEEQFRDRGNGIGCDR